MSETAQATALNIRLSTTTVAGGEIRQHWDRFVLPVQGLMTAAQCVLKLLQILPQMRLRTMPTYPPLGFRATKRTTEQLPHQPYAIAGITEASHMPIFVDDQEFDVTAFARSCIHLELKTGVPAMTGWSLL